MAITHQLYHLSPVKVNKTDHGKSLIWLQQPHFAFSFWQFVYFPPRNADILLVFNAALSFTRIYELLKVLSVTLCVEPVWHFLYKSKAGL